MSGAAPFTGTQPVALGVCATPSKNAAVAAAVMARPTSCIYKRIDCNIWTNQGTPPPPGTLPGQWDSLTSTELDTTVDAAAAAGKKLVMCASYIPPWMGGDGITGHQLPTDPRDYANAVFVMAKRCEKRHPGTVIAWEIINEPQNGFANDTTGHPNIALYGDLLETTYTLCRTGKLLGRPKRIALASTVEIWSGGTGAAPAVGSPFRHLNWSRTLLQRLVRCLDGVGIHMYSGTCPLGTANTYDPAYNDIPGIYAAIQACTWAGAQTIQQHNTESWYFWRGDDTPTNIADPLHCNSAGTRNAAEKIEVTVSTAATRMAQHWAWWSTNAPAYNLGLSFQPQQDTTAAGNLTLDDAFNHAGLYLYDPNRAGTPTLDGGGVPALLNAFNTIQTGTTLPLPVNPVLTIVTVQLADGTTITDFSTPITVAGMFSVAWAATDDAADIFASHLETVTAVGTNLADGTPGFGFYGAEVDSTALADGATGLRVATVDASAVTVYSSSIPIVVANTTSGGTTDIGYFAENFYPNYTIPASTGGAPNVAILAANPNPLTSTDTSLVLSWQSDQAGSYVVSVGNATVASGTCTALSTTTNSIGRGSFADGNNNVTVTVTNANGTGTALVVITKGPVAIPSGLAWSPPSSGEIPREEITGEVLPNRLMRHIRQPEAPYNVFILRSGIVVQEWYLPNDPPRVSLWGAVPYQVVSQADADILRAAGYGANLIAIPWDTAPWDAYPWDI